METKISRSFEEALDGRAVSGQLTHAEQFEQMMAPLIALKARPRNVLTIPYYVKSLATYTDQFSFKSGMSLKDLIDSLQPIYEVINYFIGELR